MLSEKEYQAIKVAKIRGRYITHMHITDFCKTLPKEFELSLLGQSVKGNEIHSISWGLGATKIMMWSQMHGNETTTTKAILDLLHYLQQPTPDTDLLYKRCALTIVPILNPDGAEAYTRENANAIDLNRDAQHLTQPESILLQNLYQKIKPDFGFNLHDQRTMYSVGNTNKSATVSFLAPAYNEAREISPTRATSMRIIDAMNKTLQKLIPDQVGRYDDAFNVNCVGDTFQMNNTPTILFEAGHYEDDYDREKTRMFIFHALHTALRVIATEKITSFKVADYLAIPENGKLFFDVLIKNADQINANFSKETSLGIRYTEILEKEEIILYPEIEQQGSLVGYFGHRTINCLNNKDLQELNSQPALLKLLQ